MREGLININYMGEGKGEEDWLQSQGLERVWGPGPPHFTAFLSYSLLFALKFSIIKLP